MITHDRPFTPEEAALWEESAQYAYRSFRDKAAASRNMPVEDMQVGLIWGCWGGWVDGWLGLGEWVAPSQGHAAVCSCGRAITSQGGSRRALRRI